MSITQSQARAYRKQANELQRLFDKMLQGWGAEWPDDSVCILTMSKGDINDTEDSTVVRTARRLGHPVVVTERNGTLYFHAVRPVRKFTDYTGK